MNGFTGTGVLLRLAIRRDRIQLPVWLLGLTGVFAASAASVTGLYDTEQARLSYATTTSASVVARAFNGLTSGPSLGAIVVVETYITLAVLAVLMSTFAVVRHTRQNEETGRAEMIESGVVGRYAALTAAITIAVGANAVLALLLFAVLVNAGLPVAGSALAGAAIAASGVAFTGVAAVAAQVAESARAANGLAAAALGLAFIGRASGDAFGGVSADGMSVVSSWPTWLSPLGWGPQVRPFVDNAWWLLGLPLGLFVVLTLLAYLLIGRRDLGTGLLPTRPGPATAAPALLSPLGLAWRLQRGVLLGWAVAVVVVGAVFGGIGDEVRSMTADNPEMADMLRQLGGGADLVDAFMSGMLGISALAIAAYTVQSLLRLRGEETGGHLEPVLATGVSRPAWLASHTLIAALGSALLLVLTGATAGLVYGLVIGDVSGQLPRLAGASLVWLPATLALGGFVLAAFGLAPRWTIPLAWTGLAVCLLMGQIGALLELPQAVLNASPFTHVPAVPGGDLSLTPLLWLVVTAAALGGLGLAAFRRRDLAS
jgi:ABC-2 type transport system permease protein